MKHTSRPQLIERKLPKVLLYHEALTWLASGQAVTAVAQVPLAARDENILQ
uniref:Uncharacterized protein n=1 Tax=Candidozyma auris TaxID=498019 RepID=A0A0L0P6J9_CANAR